jgi:uncharacterized protein with HEPN domain
MKITFWLNDIIEAVTHIEQFVDQKTLQEYVSDEMLRAAVERKLEIIGEAINRIAHYDAMLVQGISDHRRIIDFRNVLAHQYDVVNSEAVWRVIQEDLPVLRRDVEALLGDDG